MGEHFLLPVNGEKVAEGRMRGSAMLGGNARKAMRARGLRKVENEAEAALWEELRGRRLNGHKFVRQLPIGPYLADFAYRETNLVVEVDGSQHAGRSSDRYRDETMNGNGWSVLRFWHADVLKERKAVLETILVALEGRLEPQMLAADVRYVAAHPKMENLS